MTKWPMVPLGEVIHLDLSPETVQADTIYPIVGIFGFGRGVFARDAVSGGSISASQLFRVKANQFIYSKLKAFEGAFALVPNELDGRFVSNEFPTFSCDTKHLLPAFLYWYFRNPTAWTAAARSSTGIGARRERLKPEQLLKTPIPLPPLREQQQLVEYLDALSAKIEDAKGLRQDADIEAVALTNAVRRSLIGEQPELNWIPLSTYVSFLQNGWSPSCEKRRASDGEWAVLKVGAVSFGTYDPSENKALPASLSPVPEYEVQPGDFLMSRANTSELVGACAYVEQTPTHRMLSDKLFRFVFHPNIKVDCHYLNHVLKSPAVRDQIIRVASGTSPTMKNISKEKVLALLIPDHSFAQQRDLAARLSRTQVLIGTAASHQAELSEELNAMLAGILDQVFKRDAT